MRAPAARALSICCRSPLKALSDETGPNSVCGFNGSPGVTAPIRATKPSRNAAPRSRPTTMNRLEETQLWPALRRRPSNVLSRAASKRRVFENDEGTGCGRSCTRCDPGDRLAIRCLRSAMKPALALARQPENAVLSSLQELPVQPPHLRHRISIRNGCSVSEQAAQRISDQHLLGAISSVSLLGPPLSQTCDRDQGIWLAMIDAPNKLERSADDRAATPNASGIHLGSSRVEC